MSRPYDSLREYMKEQDRLKRGGKPKGNVALPPGGENLTVMPWNSSGDPFRFGGSTIMLGASSLRKSGNYQDTISEERLKEISDGSSEPTTPQPENTAEGAETDDA